MHPCSFVPKGPENESLMPCRSDEDFTLKMEGNHDVAEEQWMALPLFNRASSPDTSRNVSTCYDPEPLPEVPPLPWFMDQTRLGGLPEMPVPWLMDTSMLGLPSEPSISWLMDSPGLEEPSMPWIIDSSGLKTPPDPQIQCFIQTPLLEAPSDPPTPSSSRIREGPPGPPWRDEPILSRPGSSSRHRDSPPELLPDCITPPDSTSLARAKCPFPGCKSTARFATPRDFRRHYRQHFKRFFCHYENCPQSAPDPHNPSKRGFATRKDRDRHEAKHKPEIRCQWRNQHGEQCTRVFSRMDNMRDHVRRIHQRKS
ncbi:hypothetical protein ETB97_010288 [Aspergillus alliaceus]|uniref:C2H2-type domain-containing protein n=1 Tax=Petromyces alliaceus TaxID=209559 RepID=A0A8H5ZTS2_PETAA|nr:hypothetical protein ETB97_010288 [Aspergillus burnettii]